MAMEDPILKSFLTDHSKYQIETLKDLLSGFDRCESMVLYLLDIKEGSYSFISEAIEQISGYPVKNFKEGGLAFLVSVIHPEDYSLILREHVDYLKIIDLTDNNVKSSLKTYEFRIKHKALGWRWLENNSFLLNTEEGEGHIFGIINDISKRKKKEMFLWREIAKREKCLKKLKKIAWQSENISTNGMEANGASHKGEILPIALNFHASNGLSDREIEVLKLIANGLSSKQLASVLNISSHTAISHRKHLLEKFKVKNTAELIKEASKSFWIE